MNKSFKSMAILCAISIGISQAATFTIHNKSPRVLWVRPVWNGSNEQPARLDPQTGSKFYDSGLGKPTAITWEEQVSVGADGTICLKRYKLDIDWPVVNLGEEVSLYSDGGYMVKGGAWVKHAEGSISATK